MLSIPHPTSKACDVCLWTLSSRREKVFLPPGKEVEALGRRFGFRLSGQHVLGRCDGASLATADDVGQVFPHLEPHEAGADELGGGEAAATYLAQFPGPHHELESNHALVGVRLLASG